MTSIALTIFPLAEPGWMLRPIAVTWAEAALKFSYSSSPSLLPSTVKAKSAPKALTSK